MKSAKLALLALLAVSLTAGAVPAYGYSDVPAPASTVAPLSETSEANTPSPSPATDSGVGVETAVPVEPGQPGAELVPDTAPDAPSSEPSSEPGETPDAEADVPEEDLGYDPVIGGGFPVPGPNTPMVTDPDGTVRSAVETDISAMHDHGAPSALNSRQGGASMSGSAARSGTIQVTLVFATLTDNRNGIDQNAARNSVTQANSYWRAMSNGRLGMSIAETRSINSSASYWQDYGAMMNTIKRDLGWKDRPDTALLVYVPADDLRSGGYGGILGGGWTSGPTSGSVLMPKPSGFSNNVVTHEFGHVLGLLHANSLKCDNGRSDVWLGANGRWADGSCTSREYGDTSDLMGYAQFSSPTISSYFWDAGGFGRGDEVYNAGTPGSSMTYTLRPWAGSSANRAVKFRDSSGETYYVELRLPIGYDASTAVGGNRGVKIVKADLANSWAVNSVVIAPNTRDFAGYTNANSTWQAGQTFSTHTGTLVTVNWVNAESASVTISGGAAARASAPIDAARAAHPGLGEPTSGVIGGIKDNGAYRNYQNGAILWSPATGARVTANGDIRDAYQASGFETGSLGYPTSDKVCGIKDGGCYQNFQGGAILWSPATGAQLSTHGDIRTVYQANGFETGILGYPTNTKVCGIKDGGCYQNFQGGAILWSPATGAQISSTGAIRTAYQASGFETGPLGYPTSGEVTIRGGKYQNFQNGAILWSPSDGAHASPNGTIREAYRGQGFETGPLGYPTSGEVTVRGGKYQNFQNGAILWSATTGTQISPHGPIRTAYQASGFETGPLGYPTSGEVTIRGGKYQNFQNGAILWSPSHGAHASPNGTIREAYRGQGFETGPLGYPTSGEVTVRGGKYQNFQNGAILWSATTGTQISPHGPIRTAYQASGFETGTLGYPTSGEVTIRGGKYQNFQNGAILWSPSHGAHASPNGTIREAYRGQGFETGRLGYPKSGEYAVGKTTVQDFEGGQIIRGTDGKATIRYQ